MGLAPRQWALLLTFYVVYLLFGALVFYEIEHELETVRREDQLQKRIDINGIFFFESIYFCHFFFISYHHIQRKRVKKQNLYKK